MITNIYSRKTAVALIVFSLSLLLLPPILKRYTLAEALDACYINRELERPFPTLIPLGDSALHNSSVLVMWLSMLILSLLPNRRALAMFRLTYASLWFHATYILLAALKVLLDDFKCTSRNKLFPNGISGHYCYFIFVTLTAPVLARSSISANQNASKLVISLATFLLSLFSIGGVATLYRTYFHGYHSTRHIIFGASMGICSHAILYLVLLEESKTKREPLRPKMLIMLSISLTVLCLYYNWWPHKVAGPAISGGHLIFHAALYGLLILSERLVHTAEAKEA